MLVWQVLAVEGTAPLAAISGSALYPLGAEPRPFLEIAEGEMTDRTRAYVWGHAIVGMVQTAGDWWLEQGEDVPREDGVDAVAPGQAHIHAG